MNAQELDGINRFIRRMSELTVYVVGCDDRNRPIETWGSGLLWERGKVLTLLTVAHNFKGGRQKRLDMRLWGEKGSLLVDIPEPGWMAMVRVDKRTRTIDEARDIDFAWANFDRRKLRTSLEANPHGVKIPPFPAIQSPPTRKPDRRRPYGFATSIAKAYDSRMRELHTRNAYEVAMAFAGTQRSGEFRGCFRFKLARRHQGHAYYRGSSGAPIADEEGNPVALVAGGDPDKNVIFATPLQPFIRYLDL